MSYLVGREVKIKRDLRNATSIHVLLIIGVSGQKTETLDMIKWCAKEKEQTHKHRKKER